MECNGKVKRMTLEEFTSNPQALKEVCEFVAGNRALYEFALKKNLSYFELHGWIKADRDRDAAYLKACLACVDARKDAIIHECRRSLRLTFSNCTLRMDCF